MHTHTHTPTATSELKKGAEGIKKSQKSEYPDKAAQSAACAHLCDGEGLFIWKDSDRTRASGFTRTEGRVR